MTLPTPSEGGLPAHDGSIQAVDVSSIPAEPPSHLIYRHQAQLETIPPDAVGAP